MRDPIQDVIVFEPLSQIPVAGAFYDNPDPDDDEPEDEDQADTRDVLEELAREFLLVHLGFTDYSAEELGITQSDISEIVDAFIDLLEDLGYTFEEE